MVLWQRHLPMALTVRPSRAEHESLVSVAALSAKRGRRFGQDAAVAIGDPVQLDVQLVTQFVDSAVEMVDAAVVGDVTGVLGAGGMDDAHRTPPTGRVRRSWPANTPTPDVSRPLAWPGTSWVSSAE